jgi:hypothetical protein
MTRDQTAMSTLSSMLAKARAPREDAIARVGDRAPISLPTPRATESVTHHARRLALPPSWQRPDGLLDHPPLLVRLWRVMGGDRGGIDSHD